MEPRELGKISDHAYDRIGSDRLTDEEKTQIETAVRLAWGRRDCTSLAVVCKDLGPDNYRYAEDGSNGNLIIATVKSGVPKRPTGEHARKQQRKQRRYLNRRR